MVQIAKAIDVEVLAEVEQAAARRFPAERLPDPASTLAFDVLRASLRAGLLFVSEEDGAVVGFACATRMEAYVHLHEMSVHPDYGRRGIGGA
ncbi:MAG: GNAT family N-acetyltransferase, partial [Bacteroidota bacterium]